MALSVSGFPEAASDSGKLINRIFGVNRSTEESRPLSPPLVIHSPAPQHRYQPLVVDNSNANIRPLPEVPSSLAPFPLSSPTTQPIRSPRTLYKRPRTSSQGFGSGSFFYLFSLLFGVLMI